MTSLEIDGLTRTFGEIVAVDDVSLEITQGEVHGLIGPNGAGKTTLFNCVSGDLAPDSGDVRLGDESIGGLQPHEITQRGLARSFQIPQLFSDLSVRDNVYLARLARETDEFRFDVTGSWENDDALLKDVDTLLHQIDLIENRDDLARSLSHGAKRRLEIVMTIAVDASTILLDEPAAGLAAPDIDEIIEYINSLSTEDRTMIVIEHNMDVVFDVCDRITVLQQGQILFTGSPAEVRDNEHVSEVYFGDE